MTHPAACPYCGGTSVNQVQPDYLLRPARLNDDGSITVGDSDQSSDFDGPDLLHCHGCSSTYVQPAAVIEHYDPDVVDHGQSGPAKGTPGYIGRDVVWTATARPLLVEVYALLIGLHRGWDGVEVPDEVATQVSSLVETVGEALYPVLVGQRTTLMPFPPDWRPSGAAHTIPHRGEAVTADAIQLLHELTVANHGPDPADAISPPCAVHSVALPRPGGADMSDAADRPVLDLNTPEGVIAHVRTLPTENLRAIVARPVFVCDAGSNALIATAAEGELILRELREAGGTA